MKVILKCSLTPFYPNEPEHISNTCLGDGWIWQVVLSIITSRCTASLCSVKPQAKLIYVRAPTVKQAAVKMTEQRLARCGVRSRRPGSLESAVAEPVSFGLRVQRFEKDNL